MTTTSPSNDEYGRVVFNESDLVELLYKGEGQSSDLLAVNTEAIKKYNEWCKTFDALEKQFEVAQPLDVSPEEFHEQRQKEWLMPAEYTTLDVEVWLHQRCVGEAARQRVDVELELFRKYGMEDALRLFIYITETLRTANVWWGVGRGSSVASYCLFLIGVHRIDSLKYDLNIKEFLKDVN